MKRREEKKEKKRSCSIHIDPRKSAVGMPARSMLNQRRLAGHAHPLAPAIHIFQRKNLGSRSGICIVLPPQGRQGPA
jgi:hypothetical protein